MATTNPPASRCSAEAALGVHAAGARPGPAGVRAPPLRTRLSLSETRRAGAEGDQVQSLRRHQRRPDLAVQERTGETGGAWGQTGSDSAEQEVVKFVLRSVSVTASGSPSSKLEGRPSATQSTAASSSSRRTKPSGRST